MIKLKNFSFLIYSVFAHTVHASIFSEFPLFSFKKKKNSEKYEIYIFFCSCGTRKFKKISFS